jgi:hypothetical protein
LANEDWQSAKTFRAKQSAVSTQHSANVQVSARMT